MNYCINKSISLCLTISIAKKLVSEPWMAFGRAIGALLLQERSYLKVTCVLLMNDIPEKENEKRH